MSNNNNTDTERRSILFKSIINNVVTRLIIITHLQQYTKDKYKNYYRWRDIKNTPHLLCQFGTLNQVKQLIEGKLEPKYSKYKWFDDKAERKKDKKLSNGSIVDCNDDIRYIPGLRGMLKGAIRNNRLEVIEYIYNRYKVFKDEIMYGLVSYALKYGILGIAKYMVDHCQVRWPIEDNDNSHLSNNVHHSAELLEYYIDIGIKYTGKFNNRISYVASENGYIGILDRICKLGYKPYESDINNATKNGHFEAVKFIHERMDRDQDWDFLHWQLIEEAIKKNYNDIAKYILDIRDKSKPLNNFIIKDSARWGKLEMVKYLLENKYSEFSPSVIQAATCGGNIDVVKFLYQQYPNICIQTYPIQEALYSDKLEVIQYIHQNYPQKKYKKETLYAGGIQDHSVVVYCLENDIACYEDDVLKKKFIPCESWMYLHRHSNQKLQYNVEHAIKVALKENHMDMILYVIEQSGWEKSRSILSECTNTMILQSLLEQLPKPYREEWDFTNELGSAVYNNHPITNIQYIIGQFKINVEGIAPVLANSISVNRMDLFVYLMGLYDKHLTCDMFTQIINADKWIDPVTNEPIYVKYILDHYDNAGVGLNYSDIVHNALKKQPIEVYKYLKNKWIKTGKLDPKSIQFKTNEEILNIPPDMFKYIFKYGDCSIVMEDIIKPTLYQKTCFDDFYALHYLIPLYQYHKRVGEDNIRKPYRHSYDNMDVARFIHLNPCPSLILIPIRTIKPKEHLRVFLKTNEINITL